MKNLESIYSAAAFAEAGEFETAREMMGGARPEKRERLGRFERIMMAVTFAEAGEHDTAKSIMREGKRTQKISRISERPRVHLRAPGVDR